MSGDKEGFGSRWSRMKRERAEDLPEAEIADVPAEPVVADAAEADAELSDAELLEKYDLPDPDVMKSGDDFSVFMKKAIPDRLRRRALRTLWVSNPVLANLDEMVDYGEDFTDAATVIENMQTVYQVGKGAAWKFKEEQERLAALLDDEKEDADEAEPEPVEAAIEEDAPAIEEDAPAIEEAEEVAGIEPTNMVEMTPEPAEEVASYRPRPMRFTFE